MTNIDFLSSIGYALGYGMATGTIWVLLLRFWK